MPSSQKKVIVRRFTGNVLPGYLPQSSVLPGPSAAARPGDGDDLALNLLDLAGRVVPVPLAQVKTVSYVRDFNLTDPVNPERLGRREFLARPRGEGLWLRVTFRSGDRIEGLAPLDLSLLDDVLQNAGVHLAPPDSRSNTLRIYVPRSAMTDLRLLGVITSPSRREPPPGKTLSQQEELFEDIVRTVSSKSVREP